MPDTCKTANGQVDKSRPREPNGHENHASTSAIHEGSQSPNAEKPGTLHPAPQTNGHSEIPDNAAVTLNSDRLIAALTEVVSASTQKALEVAFNLGRAQGHGSAALGAPRGGIIVKP